MYINFCIPTVGIWPVQHQTLKLQVYVLGNVIVGNLNNFPHGSNKVYLSIYVPFYSSAVKA